MDLDEFLLSAWRVSQCDRLKMYGRRDYEKRIHRIRPEDAPGAPVQGSGAETPPDIGFVGQDYRGLLIIGMNPGRGLRRGPNEQDYFAEVVRFSKARNKQSALRIGRRVLDEEHRSTEVDPWPLYRRFILPLLARARTGLGSLDVSNIARLNIARSKTVDDSVKLTPRMAGICFNAHTSEQIALLRPKVIVCRYKEAYDWLSEWGAELVGGIPIAVVRDRAPSRRDMETAAGIVADAITA